MNKPARRCQYQLDIPGAGVHNLLVAIGVMRDDTNIEVAKLALMAGIGDLPGP
jgi:hypothetical protein